RWGGRMDDDQLRRRQRQPPRDPGRTAVSSFTRIVVFGLYLLHRVQSQFGRIQVDGAGALWRAALRGGDPARTARSEGGRVVPAQHALFRLRRRPANDALALRTALWWAAAPARIAPDAARHGPGAIDPGRDRGNHVPHGAARPPGDWPEAPLPCGRCRVE